jgi:hypothetical protein
MAIKMSFNRKLRHKPKSLQFNGSKLQNNSYRHIFQGKQGTALYGMGNNLKLSLRAIKEDCLG